jgi:hypothetical protein
MRQSWFHNLVLSLLIGGLGSLGHTQEICNSLLQHGIYELAREVTSDSSSSVVRSEFSRMYEEYKRDKTSGGAKAEFLGFGGKASFSAEQIRSIGEALFESNYSAQQAQSDQDIFRQTINVTAVEAWRECTTQFADGLRTETDYGPNLDGPLTIEMRFIGDSPGETKSIRKIVISPEDSFVCQGALVDALHDGNIYDLGPEAISLTCERKIADEAFKYRDEDVYATSATVTIDTAAGTIVRSFVSILASPPQPSLESRIAALEEGLSSVVDWKPLKLEPGWMLYENDASRAPSYMRDRLGFVHLRGVARIEKNNRHNSPLAKLDEGFRPSRIYEVKVPCGGHTCALIINPDGRIYFTFESGTDDLTNSSYTIDNVIFLAEPR